MILSLELLISLTLLDYFCLSRSLFLPWTQPPSINSPDSHTGSQRIHSFSFFFNTTLFTAIQRMFTWRFIFSAAQWPNALNISAHLLSAAVTFHAWSQFKKIHCNPQRLVDISCRTLHTMKKSLNASVKQFSSRRKMLFLHLMKCKKAAFTSLILSIPIALTPS